LTLFNAVVVAWVVGLGVLLAAIISLIPRMRSRADDRESR
jgi:UDP-GlcNAc:undecaprenyl-phosphate/decaprenyl-phosphate GlcNAc-1-phosphate transferase